MKINSIGSEYNSIDQVIGDADHIISPVGIYIIDNEGWSTYYEDGDSFRDGKIVDIFVHPESDCVWMIVECCGIYFEIHFDDIKTYHMEFEPLPFK